MPHTRRTLLRRPQQALISHRSAVLRIAYFTSTFLLSPPDPWLILSSQQRHRRPRGANSHRCNPTIHCSRYITVALAHCLVGQIASRSFKRIRPSLDLIALAAFSSTTTVGANSSSSSISNSLPQLLGEFPLPPLASSLQKIMLLIRCRNWRDP